MRETISVFGLGYVGCVSAACFARAGHNVIGVDVNPVKVDLINRGQSPIVEPGIGELICEMVAGGQLRATVDAEVAVQESSISLVAVGSPGLPNGNIDLSYIERVVGEIGSALRDKQGRHIVVIRSTVLPGTMQDLVIPALEKGSGRRVGTDIGVCVNPEFLREGSSLKDFHNPPFTVIGAEDPAVAEAISGLYDEIAAPVHVLEFKAAEMVKYACNAFHALKVSFANEIGNVCKALGIDSHVVMNVFCDDQRLNLSAAYLKPGFSFGGSCLPKDLRALIYKAKQADTETPLLVSTLEANRLQLQRAIDLVLQAGRRRVGVLGLSFKEGTDDLRESPMVLLVETLIGKGMELAIYDREVSEAQLVGANREYIEKQIPHIWSLMRPSARDVVEWGETIVVGNNTSEFRGIVSAFVDGRTVIDLVRVLGDSVSDGQSYHGICW